MKMNLNTKCISRWAIANVILDDLGFVKLVLVKNKFEMN